MDKHDFISNIERKENVYFSQVVLPLMDTQLSIFDKLKKVYLFFLFSFFTSAIIVETNNPFLWANSLIDDAVK